MSLKIFEIELYKQNIFVAFVSVKLKKYIKKFTFTIKTFQIFN